MREFEELEASWWQASYSIAEAAALLKCSRRTIYTRIREGRLTTIRRQTSQRVEAASLRRELARRAER